MFGEKNALYDLNGILKKSNLRVKALEWFQYSIGNIPLFHLNSFVNQKTFCWCSAKCIVLLFFWGIWSRQPIWLLSWSSIYTGNLLLALVSYLNDILGCFLSSVTLTIRCKEQDHEPLSLLDLKRLGKPTQSLVDEGGGIFTKERRMSLFHLGDPVKVFVLYNIQFFIWWCLFKKFCRNKKPWYKTVILDLWSQKSSF